MKNRYWLFKRRNTYYAQDRETGEQRSLFTKDKEEAQRLVDARNQAINQPQLNLALAKAYLSAQDPEMVDRTWTVAMDDIARRGRESTQERSKRAFASRAFDKIRDKKIIQTTAKDLTDTMHQAKASTIHNMKRLHNHALGMGWLPWPILTPKAWPKIEKGKRRGVTREEYEAILEAEKNPERNLYYQMLWETGGSQGDVANLTRENVDTDAGLVIFNRQKLDAEAEPARLPIGATLERVLAQLPGEGPLFPTIRKATSNHRAAEFSRRIRLLGIKGISLHSFRFSWAERAFEAGMPERFAQACLGHNSKAVHRIYARKAKVVCPPLESFEAELEGRRKTRKARPGLDQK